MARCLDCQASLPSPKRQDAPSLFEIDFARALLTRRSPNTEEGRALAELVAKFDLVAQHLLAARTTNSELETSLKIARSNLALAEANTEALEETLKRTRAPLLTSAAFTGGQNGSTYLPSSTFKMVSPETAQQLWGDPLLPSPVAASPSDDGSARGGMSFWRRKKAITPSPTPPPPLLATFSRAPTPNLSDLPPLPSSPLDSGQRDSVDRSRLSVTSNGLEDERAFLHRKLDQLSSALAVERTATHQLRSAHHSLVNERDALNSAHADLQSELENLSQALFEEANKMVADERQRAAQLEEEVYDLRAQLDDLRQAAETGLERELGMTFDSAPSTARPHLPPSPLTSDASPEMMQVASPRRSSSRPSPPALAVVTTRNDYLTAPSRSPTLRSPTTSPSPSSSTLESPIEEQQEAPLPAGRQWLKSFGRKAGAKSSPVEDALSSIAADAAFLAAPSPIEVHPPRDSLSLNDDDLLPTSVTPSPEPPTPEPLHPIETRTEEVMRASQRMLESLNAPGHDRDESLDSLSTILTTSSFHSPGIETALLSSPPMDTQARELEQARRPSSPSQVTVGKRKSSPARSPFKDSARARADSFSFTRSPPSRRRSSPPTSPRVKPPLPPSPRMPTEFSPPISPALPHSPPMRSSSRRVSRSSERSSSRFRPPPLSLHQTPPLPTSPVFEDHSTDTVRIPTPRSAKRGGLVLGLEAASVFPHRGDRGQGLPSALLKSESTPTSPTPSLGGWAKQRGAVGLMRSVPLPSPGLEGDLDRLLDNLASMGAELET